MKRKGKGEVQFCFREKLTVVAHGVERNSGEPGLENGWELREAEVRTAA
jgi:hypothetical protein